MPMIKRICSIPYLLLTQSLKERAEMTNEFLITYILVLHLKKEWIKEVFKFWNRHIATISNLQR